MFIVGCMMHKEKSWNKTHWNLEKIIVALGNIVQGIEFALEAIKEGSTLGITFQPVGQLTLFTV
jgi:hypothetical protein